MRPATVSCRFTNAGHADMKGRQKGEGGAKVGAKGEGIKPGHPRPLVLISGLSIERESRNFAGPLAVFDVQASFAPT